jgi:ABC-type glycerol-3-phosphate transport system substrate-binding protein
MKKVGDNYTALNPNVTTEWDFNQQWREKLLTNIAAGTPPDVTYTNLMANSNLANDGALLPLDAYMVLTGLKREDFITAQWDASMWNGKLYACPGGADFLALFCNDDVMTAAGLDPTKPPTSAEELVGQSLAILQKDADGVITRMGWQPDAYQAKQWGFLFGGEWYDDKNQKVTADHPGNIEAFNWIKSYVDELDPDQFTAFNASMGEFYSPGNPFATGKLGFRYDGFWTYDPLDQYAPDIQYGVAFYPTRTGKPEERKDYWIQGWMVAMPANGTQSDAAWGFIKYGFVDEAWKTGCDTLNGNCVVAQMPQFTECLETKLGSDNRITPDLPVFSETGLAGTRFWPSMPVNALYDDEVTRAYDFVIRGEKAAEEALAEVTATVQAELDKVLQG